MINVEEAEGCRSIYAQSVALVATDLTQRLFQVRVSENGKHENIPWVAYLGTHLSAFSRQTGDRLRVPSIWDAIDDWLDGSLETLTPMVRWPYEGLQRELFDGLQAKIDEAFIAGDPYLCARTVIAHPERIRRLCELANLEQNKSADVVHELQSRAWAVREKVESDFPRCFNEADASPTPPQFLKTIVCKLNV